KATCYPARSFSSFSFRSWFCNVLNKSAHPTSDNADYVNPAPQLARRVAGHREINFPSRSWLLAIIPVNAHRPSVGILCVRYIVQYRNIESKEKMSYCPIPVKDQPHGSHGYSWQAH